MLRRSSTLLVAINVIVIAMSMAHVSNADDLANLVGGEVKKVVGDCKFTEGPAWHPDGFLLFTDIPNNRIVRVKPDGTHDDWLTESDGINGLMCDSKGNVYAAQGDARQVVRLRSSNGGTKGRVVQVLTTGYEGQTFNKPNDLALDNHGGLYFTDPNYRPEKPTQPVEGVYYVSAAGETTRVIDDLPRPNGVLISDDGQWLYVANIRASQVVRYQILGPGQLTKGEVIFTADKEDGGGPDGMSLDEHGNLYTTYKSVIVLNPDGKLIGRMPMPERPSNCAFGGSDNKTLYITAQTSLYAVPMQVAGIPLRKAGPGDISNVAFEQDGDAAREIKAGPLTLSVPPTWKQEQPASRFRLAQFSVPAAEGDSSPAELAVTGPFGGTERENIERWINQFEAKDREVKMTQGESPQGKYILVELTGTYNMPVGPPIARQSKAVPGSRVINVMLKTENGNFFLKLSGPDATVKAASSAMRTALGADAGQEAEYKLK